MHQVAAVIFDMDGTITAPLLDFAAIRDEVGIAPGEPLLESMARMTPHARRRANSIICRHEIAAAKASTLNQGVSEVLRLLKAGGIKTAILTRNSRQSTRIVLARHKLHFDAIITREDALPKPDPDGVHAAAEMMGVCTRRCLVVGDVEFDIEAGRAAGAATVLLNAAGRRYKTTADFEITSIRQLTDVIESLSDA